MILTHIVFICDYEWALFISGDCIQIITVFHGFLDLVQGELKLRFLGRSKYLARIAQFYLYEVAFSQPIIRNELKPYYFTKFIDLS